MKKELTKAQKEVIKKMQEGEVINVSISLGNRANKYYIGDSVKKIRRRPIIELWDDGLVTIQHVNAFNCKFVLTPLGKSIAI